MKVELSGEARAEVERADAWWRENRPAAPPACSARRAAPCSSPATPATRAGGGATRWSRDPSPATCRAAPRAWLAWNGWSPSIRVSRSGSVNNGEGATPAGTGRRPPPVRADPFRSSWARAHCQTQVEMSGPWMGRWRRAVPHPEVRTPVEGGRGKPAIQQPPQDLCPEVWIRTCEASSASNPPRESAARCTPGPRIIATLRG